MSRFVGAVGNEEPLSRIKLAARAQSTFSNVLDCPNCLVFSEPAEDVLVLDRCGLVLGPLFATGRPAKLDAIAPEDAGLIRHSGGSYLTRAFWGGYVAMLADPDAGSLDLLRAPFGGLPCLYAPVDGGWLFGSDVESLERLGGFAPRIDWPAVARLLGAPDIRSGETCLAGLREVRGGERLTLTCSSSAIAGSWSPWDFARTERQLVDRDEAARRLRGEVLHAVAAWGGLETKTVLSLSGGLDSSIIAAAAAARGLDLHCVNVRTRDPSGDEARYATAVCRQAGLPLIERWPQVDNVDLERSDASALPRPAARAFGQEFRRQSLQVARGIGAGQLFSGGGGDNVFCSLQSVAPLVDCLIATDDRRVFWRVAHEICELSGASLGTVVRRACLRRLQRSRPAPMEMDLRFLSAQAAAIARTRPQHPWLNGPAGALPGKTAQIALLLGPQSLTEDGSVLDGHRLLFPLMSQPVVELCLRIPTWLWFDRGCNRAVARHAFERDLPAEVAWRRSKGSPDSFLVELFEANRALIRLMLLEGRLARHGLVDCAAIEQFLDDPRPVRGSEHGRILRLVDVEAWASCWPS